MRGFIKGAASLFQIFRTEPNPPGTPEDDALELLGDVEEVARDFYTVLPSMETTANK